MAAQGLRGKVRSLVTECAANISLCKHTKPATRFANVLNLVVKTSLGKTAELDDYHLRKLVGHFKSSTIVKEKLAKIQNKMGKPQNKLIQEVNTCWKSMFTKDLSPEGDTGTTLNVDLIPLSAEEYEVIYQCLRVLGPFRQATEDDLVKHYTARQCVVVRDAIGNELTNNVKTNVDENDLQQRK